MERADTWMASLLSVRLLDHDGAVGIEQPSSSAALSIPLYPPTRGKHSDRRDSSK